MQKIAVPKEIDNLILKILQRIKEEYKEEPIIAMEHTMVLYESIRQRFLLECEIFNLKTNEQNTSNK